MHGAQSLAKLQNFIEHSWLAEWNEAVPFHNTFAFVEASAT